MITLFEYEATKHDELTFKEGEIINVINQIDGGWWEGQKINGEVGWFPSNYVREFSDDVLHKLSIGTFKLQIAQRQSGRGQLRYQQRATWISYNIA